MKVICFAHTQLSESFINSFLQHISSSAAVALTAIRTCYSPNKPSDILALEGDKYFNNAAKDGGDGTEADRLFRHIVRSKHTSTLEHITYTFTIENISRACLAQLTRHRQFSFSVQSQRYVKMGSGDKIGGFEYVVPPSVNENQDNLGRFQFAMEAMQIAYDTLRSAGVPAEDARMVLPNAATCNLVMTGNLRTILEFYGKRKTGNGAQWEISELAEHLRGEVTKIDEWTDAFFGEKS